MIGNRKKLNLKMLAFKRLWWGALPQCVYGLCGVLLLVRMYWCTGYKVGCVA